MMSLRCKSCSEVVSSCLHDRAPYQRIVGSANGKSTIEKIKGFFSQILWKLLLTGLTISVASKRRFRVPIAGQLFLES